MFKYVPLEFTLINYVELAYLNTFARKKISFDYLGMLCLQMIALT